MRKEHPGPTTQHAEGVWFQLKLTELDLLRLRDEAVARFAQRFNLPPEITRRGYDTEVAIVDNDFLVRTFQDSTSETLQFLFEQGRLSKERFVERKAWQDRQKVIDRRTTWAGVFLYRRDGQRMVLLSREGLFGHTEILKHELLHSLSAPEFGGDIGFLPSLDKLGRWRGLEASSFNEGATEILRIATNYPRLSAQALHQKVQSGEIFVITWYSRTVQSLLGELIEERSGNNNPLTVNRLAHAYFTNQDYTSLPQNLWRGLGMG